jgi:hypothetical protein
VQRSLSGKLENSGGFKHVARNPGRILTATIDHPAFCRDLPPD